MEEALVEEPNREGERRERRLGQACGCDDDEAEARVKGSLLGWDAADGVEEALGNEVGWGYVESFGNAELWYSTYIIFEFKTIIRCTRPIRTD